MPKYVYVGP